MAGNSFGTLFRITTWGQSHGPAIGVVIDGCPAGLAISEGDIQKELDRRKPGQSKITTPRKEEDRVEILSGVFEGKTIGAPISLMIRNANAMGRDYRKLENAFRPGHADMTYDLKYGHWDHLGGGRASARETAARVAAGAVAKKLLANIDVVAYVKQVHTITASVRPEIVSRKSVEANIVRCPDPRAAKKMIKAIEDIRKTGDTLGGVVECVIRNVPAGLGSPVFDKLSARLAQAMMSIPATKGFEIGSGFSAVAMPGSQHNDPLRKRGKKIITLTNHAGGVLGGISNGMDIVFRVAFKPVSTIFQKQATVTRGGENTDIQMSGRHDPCVVPRVVPIVEAMTALVLADEWLIQKTVRS